MSHLFRISISLQHGRGGAAQTSGAPVFFLELCSNSLVLSTFWREIGCNEVEVEVESTNSYAVEVTAAIFTCAYM